jgi:hypothetical protein
MVVGGAAWATIPGPGGVIQGCYKTSNGDLRVAESAADCGPAETPIAWGQQGPQGPAGVSGLELVGGSVIVPPGEWRFAHAACPAGKRVIGGGFNHPATRMDGFVSYPSREAGTDLVGFPPGLAAWSARAYNPNGFGVELDAFAICANA